MIAWEHLFLEIDGHRGSLVDARNMLVYTSDGRWEGTQMPKDVVGIVNQLGAEGWEMISSTDSIGLSWSGIVSGLSAVFKRPRP